MPESRKNSSGKHHSVPVRPNEGLAARVIEAQDDERRKISRELHDSVGQSLAAVKMSISKFKRHKSVPDGTDLDEALAILDNVLAEVRTLSHLLHPPNLDLMGLRSSLSWLCEGFQQRTGISVSFEAPEKLPSFPPPAATAIFRVAQEALTNIHRHAHASHVVVRVTLTFEEFRMEVSDDGQGFANLEECRQGIGILGMQERLAELGGILQVESGAGVGSSVFATVPLVTQEMPAVPIPPQPTPRTGAARILIVDDHPAIREGVRTILGVCPDLFVCGEAASTSEALKLVQELRPDIILLDLQLGSEDGWQVVRGLRNASSSARVLIFSHHAERYVVPAAKNAGCSGFVAKSRTASELVEAVRVVLAGGKFFPAYSLAQSA